MHPKTQEEGFRPQTSDFRRVPLRSLKPVAFFSQQTIDSPVAETYSFGVR